MKMSYDDQDAHDDDVLPLLGWHTFRDTSPFESQELQDEYAEEVLRPEDTDKDPPHPPGDDFIL